MRQCGTAEAVIPGCAVKAQTRNLQIAAREIPGSR
jgi:hypothetical protein